MNNINTPITLDEMDDVRDVKARKAARDSYKSAISKWKAEDKAAYAYNSERAPERAVQHLLPLVGMLLDDIAEGDGDPNTFRTLTVLVGALQKLRCF